MTRVVAVDIGGTHARFAIATLAAGRVVEIGHATILRTGEHDGLEAAWRAFDARCDEVLPRAAAIAVASPVDGDTIRLTNNSWEIRPATLAAALGVDAVTLVNDFGAIGHAVAQAEPGSLVHLAGPDVPLPTHGVITICGPGTGLGVAMLLRTAHGYDVIECEGGHIDFAPRDAFEDALLQELRSVHGRVSVERIVAGPGLVAIHDAIARWEERAPEAIDDVTLWNRAIDRIDPLAMAALERFCLSLGSVVGDLALAQGAKGVVIAGGLGLKLRNHLRQSGFADRFAAKGRFSAMMASIPVKMITHPQPGLLGAAAAFAQEHAR